MIDETMEKIWFYFEFTNHHIYLRSHTINTANVNWRTVP